jgi:hypothetical protein
MRAERIRSCFGTIRVQNRIKQMEIKLEKLICRRGVALRAGGGFRAESVAVAYA